tara:strand:- start:336 stop:491 length:156 start_codon:yes stop_codon:yes gene_type:complete
MRYGSILHFRRQTVTINNKFEHIPALILAPAENKAKLGLETTKNEDRIRRI